MKIKRYVAKDVRGAMERVKKDMGSDAVILETRRVRQKGLFGIFKSRMVEVTASVDPSPKSERYEMPPYKHEDYKSKKMEEEIQELKLQMQKIAGSQGEKKKDERERPLKYLQQRLLDNEIDNDIVHKLIEEIQRDFPDNSLTETQIYSLINDKIGKRLKYNNFSSKRQVYCFVGPTGVGKTTTLAKLAASYSIFKEKKVGLITIDTYRVGAVEQLKTYAQLIDICLETVMSPGELKKCLDSMKDYDIVMIDTAGRSLKNSLHLSELKVEVGDKVELGQGSIFYSN